MKLYSIFLLMLLIPLVSSQEINLDHLYVNATICNDDYSYVYIFPLDKDNNTVKVDNIKIKSSVNLTNATLINMVEVNYVFFIENFPTRKSGSFDISINVSQHGFYMVENRTYEIVGCHSFKGDISEKITKLDEYFNKNFLKIAIALAFLFLLVIILKRL